jgi:predicted acetyltransferase
VVYSVDRSGEVRAIDVTDFVALTPAAYLRLWDYLAGVDMVQQVRWNFAPTHDPLEWALVEPRTRKVKHVADFLWLRVLDVPTALAARPWGADGSVVLEVDDPLGHAAGRWQVVVEGGRASVSSTDAAGIRLAADALGSLYLGDVTVPELRVAGRLGGDDDSVATLAAMADVAPTPYCVTGF